jgi:predicted nuclease with TOPRIM domain
MASSPPIIFGTFIFFAIVPAILWIITFATMPKHSDNKDQLTRLDDEISRLDDQIKELEREKTELRKRFDLVLESHRQGILDQNIFDRESNELHGLFEKVKEDILIKKRRRIAVEILSPKLRKLDELLRLKVITFHEKEQKREDLINNYLKKF